MSSPAHPIPSTSLHTLQPAQVIAPPAPAQPTTVPAPNYQQLDSDDSPDDDDDDEPDWDAFGAEGTSACVCVVLPGWDARAAGRFRAGDGRE